MHVNLERELTTLEEPQQIIRNFRPVQSRALCSEFTRSCSF